MVTEADHKTWKPDDLRPYVQHVLSLFAPDRLMFGSDWPVCLLAGSWKQVLAAFTQACGPIPSEQREQILGGTATRFYALACITVTNAMRDKRAENIRRLQSETFDVLIVGGGINGAGIARDLMLREGGLPRRAGR